MKTSEMISKLEIILKKHGDLDVIYSSDEEGNSYHKIGYSPSVGVMSSEDGYNCEFDFCENEEDLKKVNCVCIN